MQRFPLNRYRLRFDPMYTQLEVRDLEGELMQSFPLSDAAPIAVGIEDNSYLVDVPPASSETQYLDFEVAENDEFSFEEDGGIGTIDLRIGYASPKNFVLETFRVNYFVRREEVRLLRQGRFLRVGSRDALDRERPEEQVSECFRVERLR